MSDSVEPDTGGFISGPMSGTVSDIVDDAEEALRLFAGSDIDQSTVRVLLPMWRHFTGISPAEMMAIISRFPARD